MSAAGASAPAFAGSVTAPPTFQLLEDRAAFLAAISGSTDIAVTWAPIDAESIWLGVQSGDDEVSCSWSASDGGGVIPGAALAKLPTSGRSVRSNANNHTELAVGTWSISLYAQSRAHLADGSLL